METTCSARAVDGTVRGVCAGALWGYISTSSQPFADAAARRRAVRVAMARNALNFSAFLAIFSGVYCAMTTSRPRHPALAAGTAGAAAGSFIAARAAVPPRMALATAALCGFGSAVAAGVGHEDQRQA